MNTTKLGLLVLSCAITTHTEEFIVDPSHAEIAFSVQHLMVRKVKGTFNNFEGTLDYDIATRKLKTLQGSISTASIDTNNGKRDKHLKTDKFFNSENYPNMEFQSSSIETKGDGRFVVTGNLKVLGANHEIIFPVTINGPVDDLRGSKRIRVESTAVLNRRDLGITS
jgi:polyisoprenoid-binding protein YceI